MTHCRCLLPPTCFCLCLRERAATLPGSFAHTNNTTISIVTSKGHTEVCLYLTLYGSVFPHDFAVILQGLCVAAGTAHLYTHQGQIVWRQQQRQNTTPRANCLKARAKTQHHTKGELFEGNSKEKRIKGELFEGNSKGKKSPIIRITQGYTGATHPSRTKGAELGKDQKNESNSMEGNSETDTCTWSTDTVGQK